MPKYIYICRIIRYMLYYYNIIFTIGTYSGGVLKGTIKVLIENANI